MYKPDLSCFKFYINKEDLIDLKILQTIKNILGSPENNRYFNSFVEMLNPDFEDCVAGYQIRLTEDNLQALRREIVKLGVDFDKKFKKDHKHFHITIENKQGKNDISVEIEDEGVAYEKEDNSWDVYYVDGSLKNCLGTTGKYFAFNVSNAEINSLEDIKVKFKKWVDDKKKMTR